MKDLQIKIKDSQIWYVAEEKADGSLIRYPHGPMSYRRAVEKRRQCELDFPDAKFTLVDDDSLPVRAVDAGALKLLLPPSD